MEYNKLIKIFCIIPAYNEEKTITQVIDGLKYLTDMIVVVDDGSTDNTYKAAETSGAIVLKHIINRDQGAALQTGNEFALNNGADIIIHFDGDGQFLGSEAKDMIEPIINSECDLVLGSRFLGKKSNLPLLKKYLFIPIARIFNKIFLKVDLSDPQCGFRAFSSRIADKISINQDGKAHCSEILEKVADQKIIYKEIPVTVVYNRFGQNFGSGIRIIKDLILSKLIN